MDHPLNVCMCGCLSACLLVCLPVCLPVRVYVDKAGFDPAFIYFEDPFSKLYADGGAEDS